MSDYFDLGAYSRVITTDSSDAQVWFTRGLVWRYGFHHEEAVACFRRAVASDPDCAMAHWGVAYALGPFYNKPWSDFTDEELEQTLIETRRATQDATAQAEHTAPVNRP